jgi:hypothetical protein
LIWAVLLVMLTITQMIAAYNARQHAKTTLGLSTCLLEFNNLAKERDALLQARVEELERTSLRGNKLN